MAVNDLSTLEGSLIWLSARGFLSGSRARGDFRFNSDIDVYLANSHIKKLRRELDKQKVKWDSPFVGSITWWPEGTQVETSFLFPRYRKGTVSICGVEFRT